MAIACIIIDDDPFILNLLQDKLHQFFPEVEVMALASSGKEGLEKIRRHHPELVFLDVEMTDMTGFEMLSRLKNISFQTIFITSYRHYAIKAIRHNALDYLVKPIDLEELKNAVNRYKFRISAGMEAQNTKQPLYKPKSFNDLDQSLNLYLQDGEFHTELKNIIHLEGKRNYSTLYLTRRRKKLISKTLGEFESILDEKQFFRCHKSHLVNAFHIASYPNSTFLILSDGIRVPIARRKKEAFRTWYDSASSTFHTA